MEPTTVGSLWLENDLHENELEFESYMGRSKKNVRVTSDGIHAEIHEIWTCVAPAAPPLFHAAVNPCLQGESPWNWSCNSVNLRKSRVTWMRRHYVFTVISRWSTFSSTVNVCNINCVILNNKKKCWLSGVAVACQRCRASDPGSLPGLASGR